jgi:L-lactate utilization protein LutB
VTELEYKDWKAIRAALHRARKTARYNLNRMERKSGQSVEEYERARGRKAERVEALDETIEKVEQRLPATPGGQPCG